MKERGGLTATIALLIAAVFGVSYLPRRAAEPMPTSDGQSSAAKSVSAAGGGQAASGPVVLPSCEQIAKRLRRVYEPDQTVPLPASCYRNGANAEDAQPPHSYPAVDFTIAIVPSPVQTHLPLLFDRSIEVIQQAAQDSNYSYDGSWFPWSQSSKSYDSLSDEEVANNVQFESQKQPGVLVFRRGVSEDGPKDPYDRGLVIFVVGEQPTGGISDAQFEHALEWMRRIRPAHVVQPLLIVGPTFSGSLPSLARQLPAATLQPYALGARIYSGTTNSETSVHWFQRYLAEVQGQLQAQGFKGQLEYRPFLEGDGLMTDRFLCYLQHEGYDLNHVAILSEDQTAYGKSVSRIDGSPGFRCQGQDAKRYEGTPISLYYPRDIASVRSAYEQQSIFTVGKPQANAPSTSLRGSLSEQPNSERDTVRTYAGQLTPLTQEAALFGIANILESKRIEFVIVRSSNSLDQLFLSEFLRRSYPGGRVVLDGADLLFRRGVQGASLRGVMLLSTYPLLSWTQDAIPPIHAPRSSSYRVFAQDLSEGTYIAARELFEQVLDPARGRISDGPQPGVISGPISDYAPPRASQTPSGAQPADQRPATWVTVVGHRQFWPLAILNEHTETENGDASSPYGPAGPSLLKAEPRLTPQPGTPALSQGRMGLPGEMSGLMVFCALLAVWHLYCCANGSIIRPPRLRAYFAPIPAVQHAALIFLGSLLLGLLGVTLWFVVWFGFFILSPYYLAGLGVAIATIFLTAFLGCVRNFRLHVVAGEVKRQMLDRIQRWRRGLLLAWIPSLGLLGLLYYLCLIQPLTIANLFPAYWRSVYLRSGVSPLLPQVILIFGLYAWFWFNLHGLALLGDDRPVLPKVDDLPQIPVPTGSSEREGPQRTRLLKVFRMFSREGAGQNIEANALPLSPRYLKSLAVMLPVAIAVFWVALGGLGLRSLGDQRFGTVIFFAVGLCMALILADTLQLLNVWSQLRQLLIYLDRLPIRRTLATLRGLYGLSVWKLSGNVLEQRYRLISRQFESIRHLRNALAAWNVDTPLEAQQKQIALDLIAQCEKQGRAFTQWYINLLDDDIDDARKAYDIRPLSDFQHMLAATAGCIMKQVILPAWQTDSQSLLRTASPKDKDPDFDALVAQLPPHVRAAEEFFVLPYLGFIQNSLGRVRTLVFGIVTLFVAATIGVSCYPFDPLPAIGAVFLLLFALAGTALVFAYAEMCRDTTLSRISDTTPHELGWEFWAKMLAFGAGPLLGLLTTLFPSMTDFIVSFLQPGAQAIK